MKIILVVLTLFHLLVAGQVYHVDTNQLELIVKNLATEQNIPGVTVGIVRNESLEYFYSYGFADKESKVRIEPNTDFQIGSLTKPIIATLALKLHADDKVNIYHPVQDLAKSVNLGFVGGDELLKDEYLQVFSDSSSYKKLAKWAH